MPESALNTSLPPVVQVSAWRWALLQTRRDLRAGSMRFLLVAVVLAVAALSAVAFFADRIEQGLKRDAAQLLGADAVIVGDQPLPPSFVAQAQALGLRSTSTVVLASMARAPDELGSEARLVALKAVGERYPLRGTLTLGRLQADGSVQATGAAPAGGPSAGRAWVDPGLLGTLGLKLGDRLWLGETAFVIDALIVAEPDRGAGFINFSPRVMIRASDLAATELVQPASRATHRLLVAGAARQGDARALPVDEGERPGAAQDPSPLGGAVGSAAGRVGGTEALDRFVAQARSQAAGERGVRVETLEQNRPEMRSTLDRAGLFLRLVALLAALLAAVAVALVSRDFAQRRLDDCALMRVLGVSQATMARAYAIQFLLVGVLASVLGLLLGWGCHLVFVALLADLVQVALPPAGWVPVALGLGVGVLLTLGFGLPPVLQLARVPPLRVLRRDLGALRPWSLGMGVLGAASLVGLLLFVAQDLKLGGIALGGFVAALAVFALVGGLAVGVLQRAARGLAGRLPGWWTLATRQLTAQPVQTLVQLSALGVGLLALMLLVLIRTDLIASWQKATPSDAPNRFVINIQPDQVEAFQSALRVAGVTGFDWYPMARGRLVAINGRPVKPSDFTEDRAQRLVDREFNLSHADHLPVQNEVVAGRFVPDEAGSYSVEAGLADALGLKLGDRLSFDLAGQMEEGRITSLRKLDWSSMRVNFFVMSPRAQVPEWPVSYITAFRMPVGADLDRTLVQRFPNVTVVDVSSTLLQVQTVLTQVIAAVEFLFAFTLAAGLIVLMAGLMTSRERRAREWALMRSFGATQALLARVQRVELLGLGALAGALAALAALGIGWALAARVFEFDWSAPWWWPLVGAAVGALLSWAAGWWSLRGVMQRPVAETLRRAD